MPNALGFIETKGMVTAVCALDIMMKSAKVAFVGYENPGSGAVTGIVRGELAAVRHAVDTAAAGAQRVGEVIGTYVLTKLQRDLEGPFLLRAEGRRPALTSSARRLTIPEQTA
ncbi:MAG: BMC domain-containing protein [Candidatus Rokubacteria bacterium]|nr:BMC domain-containing protein [Candidatus Rokubacteria bacterium]